MAKAKVIISLNDQQKHKISEVAESLKKKGMNVEEQLPVLNRIIGTVEESNIKDLESVRGVKRARKENTFKIQ